MDQLQAKLKKQAEGKDKKLVDKIVEAKKLVKATEEQGKKKETEAKKKETEVKTPAVVKLETTKKADKQ